MQAVLREGAQDQDAAWESHPGTANYMAPASGKVIAPGDRGRHRQFDLNSPVWVTSQAISCALWVIRISIPVTQGLRLKSIELFLQTGK